MQRILATFLCAALLSGCGNDDPANALILEKRLESGDATVIAELEAKARSNPWAALALGRAYHLGLGTEADLAAAMQSYSLAQKIPGAWFNAGLVYSQYFIEGLAPNGSAEPGNACFAPSSKSSAMKAVDCLTHAAETTHPIEARITLGKLYRDGQQDLAPNHAKACLWFSRAADEHDDEGRYQYAMCLLSGDGAPKDTRTGTRLLLQAAKSYHADAIQKLASLFRDAGNQSETAFWMLLLSKVRPSSQAETEKYLAGLSREDRTTAKAKLGIWLSAHNTPKNMGSHFTAFLPVSVADLQK